MKAIRGQHQLGGSALVPAAVKKQLNSATDVATYRLIRRIEIDLPYS